MARMLSRRRFLLVLGGAIASLVAACSSAAESLLPRASPTASSQPPTPTASPTPSPTPSPSPTPTPLTLRQKIAQMFIVGFHGRTPAEADATLRQVADMGLGGVLLFAVDPVTGGPVNVESPRQLAALTGSLQAAATLTPLTVAIDQEGGQIARLTPLHGFPPPARSAADLGRLNDLAVTRAEARAMAEVLAAAGVTLNLAPVVDLAINPANAVITGLGRSYGADADLVASHAAAFIEVHRAAGVRCALKHFPGHGSSFGDTHLGVVDVTTSWTDAELGPYTTLISAGSVDAVLTAHVFNSTLDRSHPATLSQATVTGLLRGRLGWDGLVISDDIQMSAIRDVYGFEEAVLLAIGAGVDMVIIANPVAGMAASAVDTVEGMVRSGAISEERIDQSWQRISAFKTGA